MAMMYPPEPPPPLPGHQGELKVYTLLRDAFPDEGWHIFYDVRFWSDRTCTTQRNIDFIIVNPDLGVLMVEVKGGEYDFISGKGWCKKYQGAWAPDTKYGGAYNQLNTAVFAFIKSACNALGWDAKQPPFRHGQGMIFPFCSLSRTDGRLPAEADGDITAEARECQSPGHLRAWVLKRMRAIAKAFPSSGKQFDQCADALVKKYLSPSVRSYTRLASIVALNAEMEELLTAEQRAYAKLFVNRDRLLVEGYAGTGKTFLAILLALRFAQRFEAEGTAKDSAPAGGPSVAILCFNENLANQIDRDALPPGHKLKVRHFHGLLRDILATAGISEPAKRDETYLKDGCIELLAKASAEGRVPRYRAILIDEGQDFWPHWISAIQTHLMAPGGKFFVFNDPLQDVRGVGGMLSKLFGNAETIQTNCRNTRHIAKFIQRMDGLLADMEIAPFSLDGVEPVIIPYDKSDEQCPKMEQLILTLLHDHGLLPRQILLLSPFAKAKTCLAHATHLAGMPLVDYAKRYDEKRPRVLFHETVTSFKGCEADVVILHDVHGQGANVGLEDLYVACSRARAGLFIFRGANFEWPAAAG